MFIAMYLCKLSALRKVFSQCWVEGRDSLNWQASPCFPMVGFHASYRVVLTSAPWLGYSCPLGEWRTGCPHRHVLFRSEVKPVPGLELWGLYQNIICQLPLVLISKYVLSLRIHFACVLQIKTSALYSKCRYFSSSSWYEGKNIILIIIFLPP